MAYRLIAPSVIRSIMWLSTHRLRCITYTLIHGQKLPMRCSCYRVICDSYHFLLSIPSLDIANTIRLSLNRQYYHLHPAPLSAILTVLQLSQIRCEVSITYALFLLSIKIL